MRFPYALVLLVLLAPALAGCLGAAGERAADAPDFRAAGPLARVPLGLPPTDPPAPARPPRDATVPAGDPAGPAFTLNGTRAGAVVSLVRESEATPAGTRVRYPCGGALVVVPAGAPDPRRRLDAFAYAESFEIVDEAGRTWISDRYDAREAPGNLSRAVWVANVLGGGRFAADEGGAGCDAAARGNVTFNVAVYLRELTGEVDLYYSPAARPSEPARRAWFVGPVPAPWAP